MSRDDRRRWDARHATIGRPITPAPPVALLDPGLLPSSGRALDVACGTGAVGVWLALQGLTVTGIDGSPVAIEVAQALAREHHVADSAHFGVHDLDGGLGVGPGEFDVVVCQRFRDPTIYRALAEAVAPGGLLVVTVLSVVGHDGDPGPFRAPAGELVDVFGPLVEVVSTSEGSGEAHLVGRVSRPLA